MSLETLRALEQKLEKEIPSFKVRFKDESLLMRALGLLMRPINPTFMTVFTTTLGSTAYFPSRLRYDGQPDRSIVTLSHEFVHMYDSREAGARFQLGYAAPQIWAIPFFILHAVVGSPLPIAAFLVGYIILALLRGARDTRPGILFWIFLGLVTLGSLALSIFIAGWWTFVLLAGLVCLGPWASKGRTHWEVRGYTMNLAIYMWLRSALVPEAVVLDYVKNFTGSNYWFMCRDAEKVESQFALALRMTLERKLQCDKPYSIIHDFLVEQGRVAATFST
jgi:hypothetical protein